MRGLSFVVAALCLAYAYGFLPISFKTVSKAATRNSVASRALQSSTLLRMAVTDAPTKIYNVGMGGMFTNSSPESRRVIPDNKEGKTKFKIVYVVLESQYQSALTKACNSINAGKEGVAVEAVGYLLEELRSPAVLEQFKKDISEANIFIGSLIFVQELADKVNIPADQRVYFNHRKERHMHPFMLFFFVMSGRSTMAIRSVPQISQVYFFFSSSVSTAIDFYYFYN